MTRQTIKNALEKIGVTDGQKQAEFFAAFAEKDLAAISDNDITAALNKIGVTDEKTLGDFFAAVREPEIMDRELDADELDAVAGGDSYGDDNANWDNCVQQHYRALFVWDQNRDKWDFNCAATVYTLHPCENVDLESYCSLNDGCTNNVVIYVREHNEIPPLG